MSVMVTNSVPDTPRRFCEYFVESVYHREAQLSIVLICSKIQHQQIEKCLFTVIYHRRP